MLVPLALSTLVFAGITQHYFASDDFLSLFRIVNDGRWRFVWQVHDGHLLLVRNAIFALHHALFGLDPAGYFATVLANHLLNVLLLFAVIRRWSGSTELACVGASLWGTTPTSMGTLGWYSVYGQVIATAALLALLLSLVAAASRDKPPTPARLALWGILLFASAASFGTALGAAIVFPAVALLVCPPARRHKATAVMLVAIPLAIGLVYMAVRAGASLGGQFAPPRGVFELLSRIGPPTFQLVAAGSASLLLGAAYPLSHQPDAVSYLAVAFLGTATAWVLARGQRVQQQRVLAAMLVTFGCYGVIALGRAHQLEQIGLATSMLRVRAHYHYMALAALALWMCLLTAALWRPSGMRRVALAALVLAVVGSQWVTGSPSDHNQAARVALEDVVDRLTREITAQPPGATVCITNRRFAPTRFLHGFPGDAGVFLLYLDGHRSIRERRVFFVESWPRSPELRPDSRIAPLLVDADRCRDLASACTSGPCTF